MDKIIPEYVLRDVISCIIQATHSYPYMKVNELIRVLQNLKSIEEPVNEASVNENPT